jgi:uncharacterized protein (DUF2384 family)
MNVQPDKGKNAEKRVVLDRMNPLLRLAQSQFGPKFGERWMMAPQPGLGGRIPSVLQQTQDGAEEVRQLLRRLATETCP